MTGWSPPTYRWTAVLAVVATLAVTACSRRPQSAARPQGSPSTTASASAHPVNWARVDEALGRGGRPCRGTCTGMPSPAPTSR
jgi:hypothetical protein